MQSTFASRLAQAASLLVCAAVIFAASVGAAAQTLRIGGTGSALGTMRLMEEAFARQGLTRAEFTVVPNLGSSGALRALQAGAIDVALASRALKPEETAAGLVGWEYARSPFVFVTSKSGVRNVSASLVADVLSGRQTSWPDGQPVRYVMRPQSDGDNVLLAAFSPDIAAALKIAHQRPGMVMAPTDQEAADEAERLPGSLAANTLALIVSEHRKLNVIAFDGMVPSAQAIAAGSYPYFKRLYIVTRGAPSGAMLQFVEFVRSPKGRAILEANGHFVVY